MNNRRYLLLEEWKDILGYEGYYQISNKGRVRSLSRFVINNGTRVLIEGKIISLTNNGTGYYQVKLFKNNHCKHFYVHVLVARHFVEGYADGLEVNHKDCNKNNNCAENLEWVTKRENQRHQRAFHTIQNEQKQRIFHAIQNEQTTCPICKKIKYFRSKMCLECSSKAQRKVNRPSKTELEHDLLFLNFTQIAKKYNVSDNAIRKWCHQYGLPTKCKEVKELRNRLNQAS